MSDVNETITPEQREELEKRLDDLEQIACDVILNLLQSENDIRVIKLGQGMYGLGAGTYNLSNDQQNVPCVLIEPFDTPHKIGETREVPPGTKLSKRSIIITLGSRESGEVLLKAVTRALAKFDKESSDK